MRQKKRRASGTSLTSMSLGTYERIGYLGIRKSKSAIEENRLSTIASSNFDDEEKLGHDESNCEIFDETLTVFDEPTSTTLKQRISKTFPLLRRSRDYLSGKGHRRKSSLAPKLGEASTKLRRRLVTNSKGPRVVFFE